MCELRITHQRTTRAFDQIVERRAEVEATLGPLEWLRQPETRVSRVLVRRAADPTDQEHWPEIFAWFQKQALGFREVFTPLIRALDLEDEEGGDDDAE